MCVCVCVCAEVTEGCISLCIARAVVEGVAGQQGTASGCTNSSSFTTWAILVRHDHSSFVVVSCGWEAHRPHVSTIALPLQRSVLALVLHRLAHTYDPLGISPATSRWLTLLD
jgi:hypothetical protein